MPSRYPPYQTCHRRFQKWEREGGFDRILQGLAEHLRDMGKVDLTEVYIDGNGYEIGSSVLSSEFAAEVSVLLLRATNYRPGLGVHPSAGWPSAPQRSIWPIGWLGASEAGLRTTPEPLGSCRGRLCDEFELRTLEHIS